MQYSWNHADLYAMVSPSDVNCSLLYRTKSHFVYYFRSLWLLKLGRKVIRKKIYEVEDIHCFLKSFLVWRFSLKPVLTYFKLVRIYSLVVFDYEKLATCNAEISQGFNSLIQFVCVYILKNAYSMFDCCGVAALHIASTTDFSTWEILCHKF